MQTFINNNVVQWNKYDEETKHVPVNESIGINSHVHYVCHLDIYGQKTKKMFAVSGTQVLEGDMVNYDW